MMRKFILFAICACFLISPVYSESLQEYKAKQTKKLEEFKKEQAKKKKNYEQDQLQKYKKYKKNKTKKQKEFDAYRRAANEKFADRMKKHWKEYAKKAALPVPKSKKPPKPDIKKDNKQAPAVRLNYDKIVNSEKYDAPEPIAPIDVMPPEKMPADYDKQYKFIYHGATGKVRFFDSMRFSLSDVSEASVAAIWKKMASEDFDLMLSDCFDLKKNLRLGDWGYIDILRVMSEHFLGEKSNEAVLLQMYVLVQSGYKVRIAKTCDRLILLVPFRTDLYSYDYFVFDDNMKYYILDKDVRNQNCSYDIYEESFPREKAASLEISGPPRLGKERGTDRIFQSVMYENAMAEVLTNKNLIDFYSGYPMSGNWDNYVHASLSDEIKNTLYPALKAQISGKTKLEAANILLNFAQTAFQYMTDQEQFGYERPFFGDEIFYYPYSDCEDRSILFAILVRELLGLDVVLLHYPEHLATAVNFGDEDVYGSYFNVDGKKYIVSDPTYIGAPVGECMERFQNTNAEIIRL